MCHRSQVGKAFWEEVAQGSWWIKQLKEESGSIGFSHKELSGQDLSSGVREVSVNGKNKMEDVHCVHARLPRSDSLQPYGPQPGSFCLWGFSRQEYWSGLPCPSPRDLPNPGTEPTSIMSPALAGGFFTISITWEDVHYHIICHGERGAQPKCPVIGDCVYHGTTILYLPC